MNNNNREALLIMTTNRPITSLYVSNLWRGFKISIQGVEVGALVTRTIIIIKLAMIGTFTTLGSTLTIAMTKLIIRTTRCTGLINCTTILSL